MQKKKIALLDTDFIFKTTISRSETDYLIDKVLLLPDYQFCCHGHILTELSRHTPDAQAWVMGKVQSGEIICYSDNDILDELEKVYGSSCCMGYLQFLREACNAFGNEHFSNYYSSLLNIDYTQISKQVFLTHLSAADNSVGRQNSLGEIKTYVLLQMLNFMNGQQVYIFCSDDQKARTGIIQFPDVCCISVLSAFAKLKDEIELTESLAQPYYSSWLAFCAKHKQTDFRVLDANHVRKFCKVPCAQVFQDLYNDKFIVLADGNLKYKL